MVFCGPKKESHASLKLLECEFTLTSKHHSIPKPSNNNTACFMSPGSPGYVSAPGFR